LDGMTGRRHNSNAELMGQGIGNLVVPFFGGITATAALARSTALVRAGAETPVASMLHAVFVGLAVLVLAPWLSWLPLASLAVLVGLAVLVRAPWRSWLPMAWLAALLLMVAWNMSEARKVVALLKRAPLGDVLVLLTCLSLTVLFDMVIAIATGIVLASLLFMRDVSRMTRLSDITHARRQGMSVQLDEVPEGWAVFKITGPLFFAAADRVFAELAAQGGDREGLILYMDGVPLLD